MPIHAYFGIKGEKTGVISESSDVKGQTEIKIFEAVAVDPDREELDPMEEISFSYNSIVWKHESTGREHEYTWGHEF